MRPSGPTCAWPTARCARPGDMTRSSTIEPPGCCSRPRSLEAVVGRRCPVERGRRGRLPGRDLEGDHLMRLEHDRLRGPGEELRALAVAGVHVDVKLLVRRERERGDVRGIKWLAGLADVSVERSPDSEAVAKGERL